MSLSDHFNFILDNYLDDHFYYYNLDQRPTKKLDRPTSSIIKNKIPSLINSYINTDKYKITGSVGKGNMTLYPWIAIMDREICKNPTTGIPSAQFGYDIVYLFDSKMNKFYLSLNQGWTQYENRVKKRNNSLEKNIKEGRDLNDKKTARIEISNNAKIMQQKLKSGQGFNSEMIDLSSKKNHNSENYELGNVASKCYYKDNLPSEKEFLDDLMIAIGLYRELEGQIGSNIMDISGVFHSPIKQKNISSEEKETFISKKASITGDKAEQIFRHNSSDFFDFEIKDLTDDVGYGYDFSCIDNEHFIEVKGFKNEFGNFRMTSREWKTAREMQEKYFLVLVSHINKDYNKNNIKVIQNPYNKLIGKEDIYYPPKLVEFRFKIDDVLI